jgi:hypothetical protein
MGWKVRICVGYDALEDTAWQACRFSLQRHTSERVRGMRPPSIQQPLEV